MTGTDKRQVVLCLHRAECVARIFLSGVQLELEKSDLRDIRDRVILSCLRDVFVGLMNLAPMSLKNYACVFGGGGYIHHGISGNGGAPPTGGQFVVGNGGDGGGKGILSDPELRLALTSSLPPLLSAYVQLLAPLGSEEEGVEGAAAPEKKDLTIVFAAVCAMLQDVEENLGIGGSGTPEIVDSCVAALGFCIGEITPLEETDTSSTIGTSGRANINIIKSVLHAVRHLYRAIEKDPLLCGHALPLAGKLLRAEWLQRSEELAGERQQICKLCFRMAVVALKGAGRDANKNNCSTTTVERSLAVLLAVLQVMVTQPDRSADDSEGDAFVAAAIDAVLPVVGMHAAPCLKFWRGLVGKTTRKLALGAEVLRAVPQHIEDSKVLFLLLVPVCADTEVARMLGLAASTTTTTSPQVQDSAAAGRLGRDRAGLSASDRFPTGFRPVSCLIMHNPCHSVVNSLERNS